MKMMISLLMTGLVVVSFTTISHLMGFVAAGVTTSLAFPYVIGGLMSAIGGIGSAIIWDCEKDRVLELEKEQLNLLSDGSSQ